MRYDENGMPRRLPLRCALGHHDDGTDCWGGYSPTCLRCGRPSFAGATPTARGSFLAVIGVGLIFVGLINTGDLSGTVAALAAGAALFVLGLSVIWWRWPS